MANNTLDYGFAGLSHLASQRVTTVGMDVVWNAIQESLALYNGQVDALVQEMCEPTTIIGERIMQDGTGTLQPIDEYGKPKNVIPSGYYDVGYPLQSGATAWGATHIAAAKMTVMEAWRNTTDALRKDGDWMKRHLLAALFDNVAWSFYDVQAATTLTIRPLALASDSVTYPKIGTSAAATDTHHLAQAAGIDDNNNPYDDIWTELMEHPGNSGPVVCYIATSLVASTKSLAGFVEVADNDIQVGANADRIVTDINSVKGFGDKVLGKTDGCWIVEWGMLPSGYIVAHAKGAGPVIAMRQHAEAELQGFYPKKNSIDGLFDENMFFRHAGFGVKNRVAAVVYYVGNATYAIPSGYDAPLSV
jgi:hypothetical protein